MATKEKPFTLNHLLYLMPEEQMVRIIVCGSLHNLEVEGTCEALSEVINANVNNMHIANVAAFGDVLKVWVEDVENA